MMSELQNWAVISVVGVIWLALLIMGIVTGSPDQLKTLADVVPFLLIGAGLFSKWGWRWSRLHPHLVRTPVLRGTWRGELESLWEDPKTKERPPKKVVYLTVDQTLTSICVRLLSDESSSEQVAGTIDLRTAGRRILSVVYQNTPTIDRREGSRPHFGGLVLAVYGNPARELKGEYWTERQSKGTLVFKQRSSKIAETYEEAESLTFV